MSSSRLREYCVFISYKLMVFGWLIITRYISLSTQILRLFSMSIFFAQVSEDLSRVISDHKCLPVLAHTQRNTIVHFVFKTLIKYPYVSVNAICPVIAHLTTTQTFLVIRYLCRWLVSPSSCHPGILESWPSQGFWLF